MVAHEGWLTEEEFQAAGRQLDALVQAFEALPFPEVREMAFDMLQAVDAMHREGLGRLIAFLRAHGQGDLVAHAADDPIIRTLLLLYDLVPGDEHTQVETALDSVRPYIHSHGGEVELLHVEDGIVHLRLSGACQGCSGSATTLKRGVETALREGFPGFKGMEVHEPEQRRDQGPGVGGHGTGFIPLVEVGKEPPRQIRRPVFKAVARLEDLPVGTMKAFDVDGARVLIANVADEIYAVRNNCPGSMAPLDLGSFTPPIVICPWHNEAYDVRTGKRADGLPGQGLAVLPIAIVDGTIQLAVNTLPDEV